MYNSSYYIIHVKHLKFQTKSPISHHSNSQAFLMKSSGGTQQKDEIIMSDFTDVVCNIRYRRVKSLFIVCSVRTRNPGTVHTVSHIFTVQSDYLIFGKWQWQLGTGVMMVQMGGWHGLSVLMLGLKPYNVMHIDRESPALTQQPCWFTHMAQTG